MDTLAAVAPVDASPTWVLSNHDVVRHATRYGGGPSQGLARARAATLAMLALPGSSYLYQGEELGLEQVDVAPEDRQDPSWFRTGEVGPRRLPGADPVGRRLAPRSASARATPSRGSRSPTSSRASPSRRRPGSTGSTLEFYRAALAARRAHALPAGDEVTLAEATGDLLELHRGELRVLLNCGTADVPLPEGGCSPAAGRSPTCCRRTPRVARLSPTHRH